MLTKEQTAQFHEILDAERLTDLSQFTKDGFCDEVPLYSRYAQLSFLGDLPREQANAALLDLGLRFLEEVIQCSTSSKRFFAALTVVRQAEGEEPIVPNLFVCNHEPERQLERLRLHEARSPFSKSLNQLLSRMAKSKYQLLEDDETLPGGVRVFIGPKAPPYPGFVTLRSFSVK